MSPDLGRDSRLQGLRLLSDDPKRCHPCPDPVLPLPRTLSFWEMLTGTYLLPTLRVSALEPGQRITAGGSQHLPRALPCPGLLWAEVLIKAIPHLPLSAVEGCRLQGGHMMSPFIFIGSSSNSVALCQGQIPDGRQGNRLKTCPCHLVTV